MSNQELENEQLDVGLDTKQRSSLSPLTNAYDNLNQFFDEQNLEQRNILEAREILDSDGEKLTDEEVLDIVNEIQYLVDSWIEEYETTVFEGKSLDELLGFK